MKIMKYAKRSDKEKIELFQNPLTENGMDIYNPTEAVLLSAGFKKYSEEEIDSTRQNLFDWKPEYIESADEIQRVYRYAFSKSKAQQYYSQIARNWMDLKVQERHYDGIMSACSYAASSNPVFARESAACILWRDAVWGKCHEFLDSLEPDERKCLSEEDFLKCLPELVWPDEPENS